jgi:hypothetical protein
MGDRTQAALLSDARIAAEFEKGFGEASCKGQGAMILLQCAPVTYDPKDPAAINKFNSENMLNAGDVLSLDWCKPPHKHKPDQTTAVLKLKLRSHELATASSPKGASSTIRASFSGRPGRNPPDASGARPRGTKPLHAKTGQGTFVAAAGRLTELLTATTRTRSGASHARRTRTAPLTRSAPRSGLSATKSATPRMAVSSSDYPARTTQEMPYQLPSPDPRGAAV